MPTKRRSWKTFFPMTLVIILFLSQIIVGLYLLPEVTQIEILAYTGVGLYIFSGLVFGFLPIIEFRRKGGVEKGKSYVHTTKVVDTGIYSIVRHPQYVTSMLWAIAGMLLFQHWIVVLLGIPILPLTYIDLIIADREAIEKFGDDYRTYMKKVPRANFLLGIIRRLRKSKQ
ncbi:MAG: methyltransferase family protein [Promethearchaeota archaeon]